MAERQSEQIDDDNSHSESENSIVQNDTEQIGGSLETLIIDDPEDDGLTGTMEISHSDSPTSSPTRSSSVSHTAQQFPNFAAGNANFINTMNCFNSCVNFTNTMKSMNSGDYVKNTKKVSKPSVTPRFFSKSTFIFFEINTSCSLASADNSVLTDPVTLENEVDISSSNLFLFVAAGSHQSGPDVPPVDRPLPQRHPRARPRVRPSTDYSGQPPELILMDRELTGNNYRIPRVRPDARNPDNLFFLGVNVNANNDGTDQGTANPAQPGTSTAGTGSNTGQQAPSNQVNNHQINFDSNLSSQEVFQSSIDIDTLGKKTAADYKLPADSDSDHTSGSDSEPISNTRKRKRQKISGAHSDPDKLETSMLRDPLSTFSPRFTRSKGAIDEKNIPPLPNSQRRKSLNTSILGSQSEHNRAAFNFDLHQLSAHTNLNSSASNHSDMSTESNIGHQSPPLISNLDTNVNQIIEKIKNIDFVSNKSTNLPRPTTPTQSDGQSGSVGGQHELTHDLNLNFVHGTLKLPDFHANFIKENRNQVNNEQIAPVPNTSGTGSEDRNEVRDHVVNTDTIDFNRNTHINNNGEHSNPNDPTTISDNVLSFQDRLE